LTVSRHDAAERKAVSRDCRILHREQSGGERNLAVVRPLAGFDSGARGGVGKTLFHDFYPGAAAAAAARLTLQSNVACDVVPGIFAGQFGTVPRVYIEALQDRFGPAGCSAPNAGAGARCDDLQHLYRPCADACGPRRSRGAADWLDLRSRNFVRLTVPSVGSRQV
jgi:hypothetical protein